ncbi:hypothetical protein ACHHYP_01786 [Achlya hypogyna]|uniref:Uncharacterized protein n=1 Tax=Achlya hypogyna TaxID=1202772 RepID=A0A1V9ZTC0_ACHHY|nr:hypothetical protein ACHHYP_01786 [Achlya hypogyna]
MDTESLQQRETKAKNLLSSIVALAFADGDESEKDAATFAAEAGQIQAMLRDQAVFRFVHAGNAYNKFFNHMITMSKDAAVYKQVAALEYLAVIVAGSAIETLEPRVPKVLDVVYHALKHQHSSVCVPALRIVADLLAAADDATPEGRRAIIEQISRLAPLILQHLHSVPLTAETTTYFVASYDALLMGLTHHSTSFRSFAIKIEQACLLVLNPPMDVAVARAVVPSAAACLGAVANATAADATSSMWTQLVERALLALHYQLDLASGKDKASEGRNRPGALKLWVKDTVYGSLPLYLQAQRVAFKFEALGAILTALLRTPSIGEKDVAAVAPDFLALLRRAFSVRADAVGKASAVSEDGRQLPSSVLFGILGQLQAPLLTALTALVTRAHVTLFRSAAAVAKVVSLACHGAASAALPALHAALQTLVASLGAGGYATTTQFVVQWALAEAETVLAQTRAKASLTVVAPKALNAKKRRRDNLPLVSESTATSLPLEQRAALRAHLNGALGTLAAALHAAGMFVPAADRRRVASIVAACRADTVLALDADAITLLGLADAVVVDAQGHRGAALAHSMQAWTARQSGRLRALALSVGESLLHPRAPPMSVELAAATTEPQAPRGLSTQRVTAALAQDMDWDDESGDEDAEDAAKEEAEDDDEEDEVDDKKDESAKRQKIDDAPAPVEEAVVAEKPTAAVEEPAVVAKEAVQEPAVAAPASAVPEADEEEFDFPDIVDED